jgi:restriction endonuclease Mrr
MAKIKNEWLRAGTQAEELGFPPQSAVMLPLLVELQARGGRAKPSDQRNGASVYEALSSHFKLSKRKLNVTRETSYAKAWPNTVRWAKQRLVKLGCIDASERGVWKLTALGRRCIRAASLSPASDKP